LAKINSGEFAGLLNIAHLPGKMKKATFTFRIKTNHS
jgi:translation initiation factor IF-1